MEAITGENLEHLNNCVKFARQFLLLPKSIEFVFDDCPSERFPLETNAAEISGNTIYLNKLWYYNNLPDHKAKIAFFVFHELRHLHQHYSIALLKHGYAVQESEATINNWEVEFSHYIYNIDEETQSLNLKQEVEIDANAYGICLMRMFYLRSPNMDLNIFLPKEAHDLAEKRVDYYFMDKPEIVGFCKEIGANIHFKKKPEIGRNDKCPCGSGKKWKKCTCDTYHQS